jgi:hypothetical protein
MICSLKSCWKCSGDLVLDEDEWRCWQCGHYYYPKLKLEQALLETRGLSPVPIWTNKKVQSAPLGQRGRTTRHINSLIGAKDRSEERWWVRNQAAIRYLDEGRSTGEISSLVGCGERQIRVIRERLNDSRNVVAKSLAN